MSKAATSSQRPLVTREEITENYINRLKENKDIENKVKQCKYHD